MKICCKSLQLICINVLYCIFMVVKCSTPSTWELRFKIIAYTEMYLCTQKVDEDVLSNPKSFEIRCNFLILQKIRSVNGMVFKIEFNWLFAPLCFLLDFNLFLFRAVKCLRWKFCNPRQYKFSLIHDSMLLVVNHRELC